VKTLILDRSYQPISFVGVRKVAKYLANNKADIESVWDNYYIYGKTKYPATLILKTYTRKRFVSSLYSPKGVFKRDQYICQYSGKSYPKHLLNIDHILPTSRGGKSSWENCVTCFWEINSAKGNKTPEEAGLTLIRKPTAPLDPISLEYSVMEDVHDSWRQFFVGVERMKF
jgi:5-methylcytosine-specific restriction endonuclease McrA